MCQQQVVHGLEQAQRQKSGRDQFEGQQQNPGDAEVEEILVGTKRSTAGNGEDLRPALQQHLDAAERPADTLRQQVFPGVLGVRLDDQPIVVVDPLAPLKQQEGILEILGIDRQAVPIQSGLERRAAIDGDP
jgi:hypothetical protein